MATTVAEPAVFVDTNVLVYASRSTSAFHGRASARLEAPRASGAVLWISRQILREYLATVTRPQGTAPPLPMATALVDVDRFSRLFAVADEVTW
jgi:predicted nucleic acid-binding protein